MTSTVSDVHPFYFILTPSMFLMSIQRVITGHTGHDQQKYFSQKYDFYYFHLDWAYADSFDNCRTHFVHWVVTLGVKASFVLF